MLEKILSLFGIKAESAAIPYEEAVEQARHSMQLDNYEEACKTLRRSEQEQHPEAMYLWALCFWQGRGEREDAGRAIRLWRKAAEMGYGPAISRCKEIDEGKRRMEQAIEDEIEESKKKTYK